MLLSRCQLPGCTERGPELLVRRTGTRGGWERNQMKKCLIFCLANVLPRAVETKSSEEKFYSCCEGRRAQGCWEQKQKCLEMSYFYPNQPIHPQCVFGTKMYTSQKIQRITNLISKRSFHEKFWEL